MIERVLPEVRDRARTASATHLQINPFVYLRDVIGRVSTHPARLVLELTPREWKRLRLDPGARAAAGTAHFLS